MIFRHNVALQGLDHGGKVFRLTFVKTGRFQNFKNGVSVNHHFNYDCIDFSDVEGACHLAPLSFLRV